VRRNLIILGVLATIIAPVSSPATAASGQTARSPGSIGIRLLDVPVNLHRDALARSYIVARLAPGTRFRRRIEISNATPLTQAVAAYPAAASLQRGRFTFAPRRDRNELSSWTSLSKTTLHLSPGTRAPATVTINVPKQASPGEHYAVIWAQVSAPPPKTGGVTLVNRVGIRLYISIGPGGAPPPNFTIGPLTGTRAITGQPLVITTIRNTGQRSLSISGNLTLSHGPGGLRAGPIPVRLGSILAPNDAVRVAVRLDKLLPNGPWRARIHFQSGRIHRTAEATVTFPRDTVTENPARATPRTGAPRPLLATAILSLVTILAITLLLARRLPRRKRKR
jgi:hypothetical protein